MIKTQNILIKALSEALEKMAFLAILPMEDDMVPPRETILTEIHFSGPQNGAFSLLTGQVFGNILAENIGAVCEVDDESCCDALKELVNVTCGLLLPFVASSSDDVFDVTVPQSIKGSDALSWEQFCEDHNTYVLNVESHLIAARFICE